MPRRPRRPPFTPRNTKYIREVGSKEQVGDGKAYRTRDGLVREGLSLNRRLRWVSKTRSRSAKKAAAVRFGH